MSLYTIVSFVIMAAALAYGAVGAGIWGYRKFTIWRANRPGTIETKNEKRERNLLDKILTDMKTNRDDWFHTEDHTGHIIANDKKNIGVTYYRGGNGAYVTILLNLEQLTTFDKNHIDTAKLYINNTDLVLKFIAAAEEIIDRRGREIAFFESELETRV